MERNEGIVRWSPYPSRAEFMVLNLNHRIIQLFEARGRAEPDIFEYQRVSKHNEIPPLNTYDWSPEIRGLVAVGTSHGEVHLLRVDDDSNASLTLPLRLQRSCQSVAFNTGGLLAVGLDRIRNDSCLQIWDLKERLADWDANKPGWSVPAMTIDPMKKLEASVSITSVRFFEDQPQSLVVGVKNQCVRIHDLRDPSSSVITFQTRCNNNIAIDLGDTNYFASSSLDQPGVVIWDRRVSGRSSASPMYLESFEREEIPWGAVLKLNRVIETERNVHIKQLRYNRDVRGLLGVLSSAGQLQVYKTNEEYAEQGSANATWNTPRLLEAQSSHDLEYPYFNPDHKKRLEDRIISFDWLSLGTCALDPRVVALRANGNFEILQLPAASSSQLSKVIPWRHPHRHGGHRDALMDYAELNEKKIQLGSLFENAAKVDIPAFGPNKFLSVESTDKVSAATEEDMHSNDDPVIDLIIPTDLENKASKESLPEGRSKPDLQHRPRSTGLKDIPQVSSSRELHDRSHYAIMKLNSSVKDCPQQLDRVMLKRAGEGYLFDCQKNMEIVKDDRWLRDVWEWIDGAEDAAEDDGMVSMPLDLSYMGVYNIWMNLIGATSRSRLIDTTVIPDSTQWERLIAGINQRAGYPNFEGLFTEKPHHRQLCLAICGLVKLPSELESDLDALAEQGRYTMAAAWALFEGLPERAVDILKSGGTDLLFVAMALDIKLKSQLSSGLDSSEWSHALKTHPQMAHDPYLRAIYGYITTGDWLTIADETSLPLRDRVGVALRKFSDAKLTEWLTEQMEEAIRSGDIEGIVLAGISDDLVDILQKYVEKFKDYQTPILILSFCYPRYVRDIRCAAWRSYYQSLLQHNKLHILRVRFELQSTVKSRRRDGTPVIKQPPRQVTVRCLNCDFQSANDLANSGAGSSSGGGPSGTMLDLRNPLTASGVNSGLSCPRCGAHLSRCAVCMEFVGLPRSDRPELSNDPAVRRMANFPSFCLQCKHVLHMDHSVAWFGRHIECPVPECRCQCNEMPNRQTEVD